jgi:O-antigen/teichoic acid export membrane protein
MDACLLSWILALFNTNISVLIAKQRINASNILTALQSLLVIIVLVVLFAGLKEKTIRSYITALYISYGISFVASLWVIRGYFIRPQSEAPWRPALKNLATLGFYNQVAVFAQMLSFRLSYYILNQYSGTAEVGIYSNAVSVAESLWLIGRSIGVVQHSRIVNNNDDGFARKLTSQMNLLNLSLAAALLIIMAFIPSDWYQWLFGKEFIGINRLIWALSPGILFFGIVLIIGYYFSSTGRHWVNAISSSAGLVVTLVAGFILIPAYRGMGAAITSGLSYGTTALLVLFFYRKQLQKNFKK